MRSSIRDTSERERVAAVWRRYGESSSKRRAWSNRNAGNACIRAELVETLRPLVAEPLAGDAPLLDIGCGAGWWLRGLAGQGVDPQRLHGVDILGERLERLRGRLPGATVVSGDARALPFADGRFALVTFFTVLSSLRGRNDARAALSEAWRVLAPGGLLVVYDPIVPTPLNRATRRVGTGEVARALGSEPEAVVPVTVFPPLARRLGARAVPVYGALRKVRPLLTHRVQVHRRP